MVDWFNSLSLDRQNDLWVVAVAALTNSACALVGCYLVLRRMSLLGDAISHAVLPGLVVAFVFSGSLNLWAMSLGALTVGLLTGALTQSLHRQADVPEDVSMGVVFTSLFALGVVLIKRYAHRVDLDPDCVLYGLLEYTAFNLVQWGGYEFPEALPRMGVVLLVNAVFIVLFWKELLISSFDPAGAETMGIRAGLMHYALLSLVALTTVASFEQVGSILVIAMLIVPGATAHLLTDRLGRMLAYSVMIATASAVLGHLLSVRLNTNTAGTMAVVVGGLYIAAALFSPRYGVLASLAANIADALRVVREDLLALLYRWEEIGDKRPLGAREAIQSLGGGWRAALARYLSVWRGEVCREGSALALTDRGRQRARALVRSHRLWESYLSAKLGLPADHVHEPAMRMEHYIAPELEAKLTAELSDVPQDPHGRPIPAPPAPDDSASASRE